MTVFRMFCRTALVLQTIGVLVFSGCRTDKLIPLNISDQSPRQTIMGVLDQRGGVRLQFTQSQPVTDDLVPFEPPVTDAQVTIEVDGGNAHSLILTTRNSIGFIESFYESGNDFSWSGSGPYTLLSESESLPTVTATISFPEAADVFDVSREDSLLFSDRFGWLSEMRFRIRDVGGQADFYMIRILDRVGTLSSRFETDAPIDRDIFFDPELLLNGELEELLPLTGYVVFNDDLFDGQELTVTATFRSFNTGYVEISTINEAFYNHETDRRLQAVTNNNPFAEPVPVRSNIEGGFGVIGTSTLSHQEVVNPVIFDDD